jgi:hypothetical protein
MRKVCTSALAALLMGIGLFPGVGATAMMKLSLEQLTREADTIVLGTVTTQVSAWNDQHTGIYTDVIVDVEEAMKGSPGAAVTFRVAGGVVGEIGMGTSTDATFEHAERVIVFLHSEGRTAQLFGRWQGKFTVRHGTVIQDGQVISVANFMAAIRAAAR